MRMQESHHAGRAIIIFRYFFFGVHKFAVFLNIRVYPASVMFHAHVKRASERSELTPCIIYNNICRDISQLSSADEERLHSSLDSTDGNLASDVSTRRSGRPQLNSLRTTRASDRNVES